MAKEHKKSFVLYYDYRNHLALLSDEERGRLLMALLDYAENGKEPDLAGAALMAFSFIRSQMDRDAAKYAETVQKRREAGKQGGRPPKASESNEKQEEAKKANGFREKQSEAKKPDNDTDNGTDNDTDNGTDIKIPSISPKGDRQPDTQERRFAEFWDQYPKKVGKQAAKSSWNRIKPNTELFDHIMQAVTDAKQSEQWTRDSGRFIPNPATWLNQGRWDDVLTPANAPKEGGQHRGAYNGHTERPAASETALSGFRMAAE
jgi:hypothetical protein